MIIAHSARRAAISRVTLARAYFGAKMRRGSSRIELKEIRFQFDMALQEAIPAAVQPSSFARRGAVCFEMSGSAEFVAATAFFVLMILIRIVNILYYRFDNDEPQHLHVIWGWAHGFIQYRSPGRHNFESAAAPRDLILLWAQAVARRFTPFEHHPSPNG